MRSYDEIVPNLITAKPTLVLKSSTMLDLVSIYNKALEVEDQ